MVNKASKLPFSKKVFWISIEGADGVGKTTISRKLHKLITDKHPNYSVVYLDEFSDSQVGRLISQIIKKNNFFRLSDPPIPLSETLLLLSDLFLKFEKVTQNATNNTVIISDRGIDSFFTYQLDRISSLYQDDFEKWIKQTTSPLPTPNLSVYLITNTKKIKDRLIRRHDKVTKSSMNFISKMQKKYINLAKKKNIKHKIVITNNKDSDIEKSTLAIYQKFYSLKNNNESTF